MLNVVLENFSDEGLDLLLRVALKTDTRLIDDWRQIGQLIDTHKISLSFIHESLWSAEIGDESEFGQHAKAAVAATLIKHYFPDGIAFAAPRDKWKELIRTDYLESELGKNDVMLFEMNELVNNANGKVEITLYYP